MASSRVAIPGAFARNSRIECLFSRHTLNLHLATSRQFSRPPFSSPLRATDNSLYLSKLSISPSHITVRLASSKAQNSFRRTVYDFTRLTTYASVFVLVGGSFLAWIGHEALEHDFPTPHSWSWNSRLAYHAAKAFEDPEMWVGGTQFMSVSLRMYDIVLKNLENPEKDGAGLKIVEKFGDNDYPVSLNLDVYNIYDISSKDENWRRGYIDTLMSLARVAEKLQGWVRDDEIKTEAPSELIIGPNHPHPKGWQGERFDRLPREGHVIPVTQSAEKYYNKLLATLRHGSGNTFSTHQVIDACLAYSTWLSAQPDGKEESVAMIEEAFDQIIKDTLPEAQQKKLLKKGVKLSDKIKSLPPTVNSQRCLHALALSRVQSRDIPLALDEFLRLLSSYPPTAAISNLRPTVSSAFVEADQGKDNNPSKAILKALYQRVINLFQPVEYPPPPPSGNDLLTSQDSIRNCAAAGVRAEAAEVLFASAPSRRETALEWTKQSLAEAHHRSGAKFTSFSDNSQALGAGLGPELSIDERIKCAECAAVALHNWGKMVQFMREEWKLNDKQEHGKKTAAENVKKELPRWVVEDQEYYGWVKTVDRDEIPAKLALERWKIWTGIPKVVLHISVHWSQSF